MIGRPLLILAAGLTITGCNVDVRPLGEQPQPLAVMILPDGALSVDGKIVDAATVKNRAGTRAVQLRANSDLKYSDFQKAMNDLQGLNVPIAIAGEDSK